MIIFLTDTATRGKTTYAVISPGRPVPTGHIVNWVGRWTGREPNRLEKTLGRARG